MLFPFSDQYEIDALDDGPKFERILADTKRTNEAQFKQKQYEPNRKSSPTWGEYIRKKHE